MAFTNYDYSSGLSALGQGVDSFVNANKQYQKQQTLGALGQKLRDGDFNGAAQLAFGAGDSATGLGILKLGQERAQQQNDSSLTNGYLGGSQSQPATLGSIGASPSPATMPAPAMQGAATLGALGTATVQNDDNALPGTVGLNQKFADRLQDFQQDRGLTLNNGFRSNAEQAMLYANRANNPNPVAPQGSSMHERGLAADLNGTTSADRAIAPQYGVQNLPGDPPHFQPSETFGNAAPDLSQFASAGSGSFPFRAANGQNPAQNPQLAANQTGQQTATDASDTPVTIPGYKGTWTRAAAAKTDPNDASTPDAEDVANAQKQQASGVPVTAPAPASSDNAAKNKLLAQQAEGIRLLSLVRDPNKRAAITAQMGIIKGQLDDLAKENTTDVAPSDYAKHNIPADFKGPVQITNGKLSAPLKATTEVNVNQSGEKAYDTKVSGSYGEQFIDSQKAGRDATSQLGTVNRMEAMMKAPGFYSGIGGDQATAMRRLGVAAGISGADNAAPNEIFDKMSKTLVLEKAGGSLSGGFSNGDRQYLDSTVPNLSNTPSGNTQLLSMARAVSRRNIEIAKMARDYARSHNGRIDLGFDDQLAQFAEANPLFPKTAAAAPAEAAAPQPGLSVGQSMTHPSGITIKRIN